MAISNSQRNPLNLLCISMIPPSFIGSINQHNPQLKTIPSPPHESSVNFISECKFLLHWEGHGFYVLSTYPECLLPKDNRAINHNLLTTTSILHIYSTLNVQNVAKRLQSS